MPSILPFISREIKDDLVKQSLEILRKCIGFVYSNENLGLNVRSTSVDLVATNRDAAIFVDTTSSTISITLPYANTWSPPDGKKTPFLIVKKTAGTNTMTLFVSGTDVISRGGVTSNTADGDFFWLYSDGVSTWYDVGTLISGMLSKTTYTTGSGTHTFNTATRYARVTLVAGGAGGGGGNNHSTAGNRVGGGGGGAGEWVQVIVFPSLDGASLSYSIGAKGTGGAGTASTSGSASDGTSGGNTIFGNYLAIGGSPGTGGGIVGNPGKGGNGGGLVGFGAGGNVSDGAAVAATSGGFTTEGIDGRVAGAGGGGAGKGVTAVYRDAAIGGNVLGRVFSTAGTGSANGAGGGSGGGTNFGPGGNGGNQGSNGTAATTKGAGGGGGGSGAGAGTSPSGGNGADGLIIIEEFQ